MPPGLEEYRVNYNETSDATALQLHYDGILFSSNELFRFLLMMPVLTGAAVFRKLDKKPQFDIFKIVSTA